MRIRSRGCIRGRRSDWNGLPADKSLFTSPDGCGLPSGNLASQLFANFDPHPLDDFVRDVLDFERYGLPLLGAVVWPHPTTPGRRLRGCFHAVCLAWNTPGADPDRVRAGWACYKGLLQHRTARRFTARRLALLRPTSSKTLHLA
jgi:hypothetical protein